MKQQIKTLSQLIVLSLVLIFTNCEKDVTLEDQVIESKFSVPNIESAKSYFNINKNFSINNATAARTIESSLELEVDWENSTEELYKTNIIEEESPDETINILYSPTIDISNRYNKTFVGSIEIEGVIQSKIISLFYLDSNDYSNFSGYMLIYNLDGNLEYAEKYNSGLRVDPSTLSTSAARLTTSNDCDFATLGCLLDWLGGSLDTLAAFLANNTLDEVVVTANNNTGDYIPISDSPFGLTGTIPAVEAPDPVQGSGGASWDVPYWYNYNNIAPDGLSIAIALDLHPLSSIAEWLLNLEDTELLQAISQYLNENRETNETLNDENDVNDNSSSQNDQNNISQDAIDFILSLMNNLMEIANGFDISHDLLNEAMVNLSSYTLTSFPGMDNGFPYNWWNDDDFILNSGNFDVDDEKPNAKEAALFALFPQQALWHAQNSRTALDKALELVLNETLTGITDGKADAFRHAFWNALGTAEFGSEIMKLFADAHEWGESGLSVDMDLYNNHKGRVIGGNFNFFSSDSDISDAILEAVFNGTLKYINSSGILINTNL